MSERAATLAATVLLGLLALVVAFVLGFRWKSPLVVDAVRRVNRAVFNPQMMRTAGMPGAFASVVRHAGRRSGRTYETPVGAVPTDDGFVIALVYGTRPDWVQNLLASGSAVIVHEGRSYHVDQPEIVPRQVVADQFSASDQRGHRVFGVDQCLRVRRVAQPEALPEPPTPRAR